MTGGRVKLTPAAAGDLYRDGASACQIAQAYGLTRSGAEARIRAGGLGGLAWCRLHRKWEELQLAPAPPPVTPMWGRVDAPEHALGRGRPGRSATTPKEET
jgi:hypothetical protein